MLAFELWMSWLGSLTDKLCILSALASQSQKPVLIQSIISLDKILTAQNIRTDVNAQKKAWNPLILVTDRMASWRDEYVGNLRGRDKLEKLDFQLIDAYTRLADRTAVLEAAKSMPLTSAGAHRDQTLSPAASDLVIQLRNDLAEALRSNGQFQSRLKFAEDELDKLRIKTRADSKVMKDLYAERAVLITKVKDRDEELKGKAKLLEDVQDEMISLNLQLNMAEQRSRKLQGDNKDLVDRWMAQKGQEADALNNASKFS